MPYWRLFLLLQRDRQIGMEPGAIPSGAVITYLRQVRRESDPDEYDRAIRMVGAIDAEYLATLIKKEG